MQIYGRELVQNMGSVQIPPQDFDTADVSSAYINMKNYGHATVFVLVGDTIGGTFTVTFLQATSQAAAGEQALAYTKAWSSGQVLKIDTVVGKPVVGETITSTLTAEVYEVGKDYLVVRNLTGGTTWTDNAAITFGTSGATAVMNGTGEQEDIMVPLATAPSSTITIPAVTFKKYQFEIDVSAMDADDGYDWFQVVFVGPSGSTFAAGLIILGDPRYRGMPMPGAIGTQKMAAVL